MVHMHKQEPDREARSPWSQYGEAAEVEISPPRMPPDREMTMPGSKSMTNRALLLAGMALGTTRLDGILRSDDAYWCIDALRRLGVRMKMEGTSVIVEGAGGVWPQQAAELYAGAAGTVARFLPGALAAAPAGVWRLRGSKRLHQRPLEPLLHALAQLGADIRCDERNGCLPLTVRGNGGLQGGEAHIAGDVSSQFVSGLLLAAPAARQPVTVRIDGPVVQRDYVDMTLHMMRAFGVDAEVKDEGRTIVVPAGRYKEASLTLEPDVSACGYMWAFAALTGGRVRINGLSPDRTNQPDIELLEWLERMGCTVIRGEHYAEVRGVRGRLRGGFTAGMNRWSDQTLTMAALAVYADAPVTLTDAAHIRHHECDRIAAICRELGKLGIRTEERPDGLTVFPGQPAPSQAADPHDDHRMAMSLALIGARTPGIRVVDPGCVSKTCPDYFDRLRELGAAIRFL